MGGDVGTCIGCGLITWGRSCSRCGGLVVYGPVVGAGEEDEGETFEPGTSRWSSSGGGIQEYEGCTVYGSNGVFAKSLLMLESPGISIWRRSEVLFMWEIGDVAVLTVDDAAGTRSRISATRVVLFGGIGFLAPKKSATAFLTLGTDDDTFVIEVSGIAPPALRGQMHSLWGSDHRLFRDKSTPADVSGGDSTVEERLRTLTRLHADGIVSDAEFATKRSELIALL